LTLPSALADAHNAAWCFVNLDGANFTEDTARLCSPYIGKHTNGDASSSSSVFIAEDDSSYGRFDGVGEEDEDMISSVR
jgi:hypothetical protein